VEAGGGLFGTHCASVTFQTANPPNAYNQLIGGRGGDGYFDGTSNCTKTAEAHPSTALLPATFDYVGNLDNADFLGPDTKVLVQCKWTGGDKKLAPVSWYRTAGKGRVFYTNFAKEAVDLQASSTLADNHIFAGLGWVLGR
jgi:type 1 glutamine amidotransferase